MLPFKLNYSHSTASDLITKCHLPLMTKKISPNVSIHEKHNYVSKLSNHSPLSIFPLTDRLPNGSFPISSASSLEWPPKWCRKCWESEGFVNDDIQWTQFSDDIQVIRKTWGVALLYKMVSEVQIWDPVTQSIQS